MPVKRFNIRNKKRTISCAVETRSDKNDLVITFYGLFDSSENPSIVKVKDALVDAGYSVLFFDYIGHGRSRESIDDLTLTKTLDDAYAIINHFRHKRIFVLGFSFGAFPAVISAARSKISGALLFNPLSDFFTVAFSKKSNYELSRLGTRQDKISKLTKIKFFTDMLKYNQYNIAKEISCPVFAFHSLDDQIIPYSQTKKLEKCILSRKHFFYLPGENHSCDATDMLDKTIIPQMIAWLKKI